MTDKKFTDEEIIKALERCSKGDGCFGCAKAYMHSANCIRILETECLDLINRQKAEIKELKNYVNSCKSGKEYWVKCLLEKPNEAIKEFAERLKQHKRKMRGFDLNDEFWDYAVLAEDIDNLLKEMVGEK